ncbi:MAG: FkbM family methyltransferase [Candidatus Magasanikbacteria bacterium]|nr:FkbM family methyltransferase [Candidatus Magasanikbacteria bacterium]
MAHKALASFGSYEEIEFWLDGKQADRFTEILFSPVERLKVAIKHGVLIKLLLFYIKCRLGLQLRKGESEVSSLVYQKIITSFLDTKAPRHHFRLADKGKNIILEADFEEKDSFLSIFRILDEYAKAVLINQYNLSQDNIRDKVVIDGGSNLGEFAIFCARLGAAKVYAFEPITSTFEILKKQIKLNNLEGKVIPVNKALGDKNEQVSINFSEAGDSSATICATTNATNSQLVEVIKLDDFVGEEKVGFIKLDVEGYEENVLLGAKKVIIRDKPVLALSAYHKPTDKERLPAVIQSIRSDYTIKLLQKAEPDFYCE